MCRSPAAQELEATLGSGLDIDGMAPAAASALQRFQFNVAAIGGFILIKSAYRPAAYQQHLRNVWYKWMGELRDSNDPACQELRAQVEEEFKRHHLIETQHPVTVSDHTRGLAFDATAVGRIDVAVPLVPLLVAELMALLGLVLPPKPCWNGSRARRAVLSTWAWSTRAAAVSGRRAYL